MQNDQVMVVGNMKTLFFDFKKIKTLQFKIQEILHGDPPVPIISPSKKTAKPKNAGPNPKPKAKSTSEDYCSKSKSLSPSSSSSSSHLILNRKD